MICFSLFSLSIARLPNWPYLISLAGAQFLPHRAPVAVGVGQLQHVIDQPLQRRRVRLAVDRQLQLDDDRIAAERAG